MKFKLHNYFFPSQDDDFQVDAEEDEEESAHVTVKQARRNDQYTLCMKYGLAPITTRFGLTAEQVSTH